MILLRTVATQVIGMLLILASCEAVAADRKEWVRLTGCQYVKEDGDVVKFFK